MANSVRQQILDAVATALAASTSIKTVETNQSAYWDHPEIQCPLVYVIDEEETKERFAFLHPSAEDMQATLPLTIVGYVFDRNNDLSTKQADLIRAVEIAIQGSTALNDLTQDTYLASVQTDAGVDDNFSTSHMKYQVRYLYNHLVP